MPTARSEQFQLDGKAANQQVAGWSGIVSLASNPGSLYGLRSDGTVWASGLYQGNGPKQRTSGVTLVQGLTAVTSIDTAYGDVFAIKSDGTVWGWGRIRNDQLGAIAKPTRNNSGTPFRSQAYRTWSVSAGGDMLSYALRADGTVVAWGTGVSGDLGNGTSGTGAVHALSPVQVDAPSAVVSIAAGERNGYIITSP